MLKYFLEGLDISIGLFRYVISYESIVVWQKMLIVHVKNFRNSHVQIDQISRIWYNLFIDFYKKKNLISYE